jgi:thiamine phosphate synthase YjbQ (UPF0047 family)
MSNNFIAHLSSKMYQTASRLHFISITEDIDKIIQDSKIMRGTVTIQTHHTTAGIWVNEDEKNLVGQSDVLGYDSDLKKVLDKFADPMADYVHNDIADASNSSGKRNTHLCEPDENGVIHECVNGHAHAQAMILSCAMTLIVEGGKLLRGKWQQVMLVELDHDRERQVSFLVQGVV